MLHYNIVTKTIRTVLQSQSRLLSLSTCCCGRKSRVPYDKRGIISPVDVDPDVNHGGTQELLDQISQRGDMPQPTGYYNKQNKFVHVPEMVPEFIVPDLTGFELKPYVSYRVPEVTQSEFTAKDLFDSVYGSQVVEDYRKGRIDVDTATTEELLLKVESKLRKS